MEYSYQSKQRDNLAQTIHISDLDKSLVRLYPRELAEKNMIIPIYRKDGILFILTVSEDCNTKVAEIEAYLDHQSSISVHQVDPKIFWKILSSAYELQENIQSIVQIISDKKEDPLLLIDKLDLCLAFIFNNSIIEGASCIHFETENKALRVRSRRNGILSDKCRIPIDIGTILLDLITKKTDEFGKITYKFNDLKGVFYLSKLKSISKTSFVLRISPPKNNFINFGNLNIPEETKKTLMESKGGGVFLVTGPRHSGKTFSLYSIISEHASIEYKTMTIEKAIEFDIALAYQIEAKTEKEVKNTIDAIPYQDIDTLMIDDINHKLLAKTSFERASSCCKVFATLTTNSSINAINKLIDSGISTRAIACLLQVVINQRLVRKLCNLCKRKTEFNLADKSLFEEHNISIEKSFIPIGCPYCFNSGYNGAIIVTEVLTLNDDIRRKIIQSQFITKNDLSDTFIPMEPRALELVANGITTLDEVRRFIKIS